MLPANSNPAARRWLLWLHLIGGLTLSLYAVLLGVSGSILVFRDELTALAYPEFHSPAAGPVTVSPDEAVAAVRAAFPDWQAYSLTFPNPESPHYMAYLLRGPEARETFVDARTGAVLGSRNPSAGWIGWLLRLHVNFHAGATGRLVNGVGALALLGMCASGVLLWWPSPGQLGARFRIDWRAGWRRFCWQLHHITGIVALLFIATLAVTGGYYVWTNAYIRVVDRFFERSVIPTVPEHPAAARLAPLAGLAEAARTAIPGRPLYRMSLPSAPDQPVQVTLLEGAPAEFHRVSTVILDPVTAAVLQQGRYESRPVGNSILSWMSVLHFGRWGELPAKILWAALGLNLPALSLTGFLMWWRRVLEPRIRRKPAAVASTVSV